MADSECPKYRRDCYADDHEDAKAREAVEDGIKDEAAPFLSYKKNTYKVEWEKIMQRDTSYDFPFWFFDFYRCVRFLIPVNIERDF